MEAALQGVPAIALSQYFGPRNLGLDDPFEAATRFGADLVRKILDAKPAEQGDYRLFYNVNFPPVPADEVLGTRVAAQGYRRDTHFSVEPHSSPSGRRFLWIKGGYQHNPTAPGTDAAVNLAGYISVTPMRADLTAHDALEALKTIE
jgi:5'-nucleotidase